MDQRRKLAERVLQVYSTFHALPWYWRAWYTIEARCYIAVHKLRILAYAVSLAILKLPAHRRTTE